MRQNILAAFLFLNVTYSIASEPLPVPVRGFVSSQPARTWEEGLICGNGTIRANALSRPLNERVIFTHERLFLPMGPPVMPADQSARLFEIRRLIDRGLYKQACQLQYDLSGQEEAHLPGLFRSGLGPRDPQPGEGRDSRLRPLGEFPDRRDGRPLGRRPRRVRAPHVRVTGAAGVAVLLLTAPPAAARLPSQTRATGTEPRVQFGLRRQQAIRPGFQGTHLRYQEHGRRLRADVQ